MRNTRDTVLASGILLAALVASRAEDDATPRAIVDRAVKAHGGQALLEKYPAMTAKLKGMFHGQGDAVAFTGESAAEGSDRQKLVIDATVNGMKFRLSAVLNRDKAWEKVNDDLQVCDDDELEEARHEAYTGWVATLAPLKDKTFRLGALGQIKINARPAVGVRVSKKGKRDVKLYFDKTSGLLVKSETRIKDDDGREVTEETFLSDYKEVQGTRQAMKFSIKRAGKLYMDAEASDYRLVERLDDRVFAKP